MSEPTAKKSTKKNAVTFCSTVRVKPTTSIYDFTEEEIRACWYSDIEIFNSRAEIRQTIALINKNIHLDDVHHCRRGLETATGKPKKAKMYQRQTAVDIVLNYQEAADEDVGREEYYQNQAAKEYSAFCNSSQVMAFMVGIADANEVRSASFENQQVSSISANRKNLRRKVQRRPAIIQIVDGQSIQSSNRRTYHIKTLMQ